MLRQIRYEIQVKKPYQAPHLERHQWTAITAGSIGINNLTILEPIKFLETSNYEDTTGGAQ